MHSISSDVVQIYLPSWIQNCLHCCVRSHFFYLCKERKCKNHWFRQLESIWHWIIVMYLGWFLASSMKSLRTGLFWVIMQRVVVIYYWCFGTPRWSNPLGSRISLDSYTLTMGLVGCPEASVRNYHYSQCNNPEERSSLNVHNYLCTCTTNLWNWQLYLYAYQVFWMTYVVNIFPWFCLGPTSPLLLCGPLDPSGIYF